MMNPAVKKIGLVALVQFLGGISLCNGQGLYSLAPHVNEESGLSLTSSVDFITGYDDSFILGSRPGILGNSSFIRTSVVEEWSSSNPAEALSWLENGFGSEADNRRSARERFETICSCSENLVPDDLDLAVIPEPTAFSLFAISLFAFGMKRKRQAGLLSL